MSVERITTVLHHSRAKGSAKVVLLGIANHDGDGGAWPSIRTLAKYANLTERNTQAAIRQLEALGELRTFAQAGGMADLPDHRRPNLYRVLVECPADCDRTVNHRSTNEQRALSAGWSPPVDNTGDARDTPVASDTRTPVASDTRPGDASITQTSTTNQTQNPSSSASSVLAGACCSDGWAGEDDEGRPIPCPTHRPVAARRLERHRSEGTA